MAKKKFHLVSYDNVNKILNVEYFLDIAPSLRVTIPLPLPDSVDTPEEISLYIQERWPQAVYDAAVKKSEIDDEKVNSVLEDLIGKEHHIDDSVILTDSSVSVSESIIDISAINVVKV